jgi:MazG family protein
MQQLIRLLDVMAQLRNSVTGCPWDLAQDYQSLTAYTLEEAYELVEAIELGDMNEVKQELGDLLFQVVFYAQLGKEEGIFDFEAIAKTIADKMVARHPHVFADHQYANEADFLKAWEQQKSRGKQQEISSPSSKLPSVSVMDDISHTLPAMLQTIKIQKKAVNSDIHTIDTIRLLATIKLQVDAIESEYKKQPLLLTKERIIEEDETEPSKILGNLLFSCVTLAHQLKIDPEKALRLHNRQFIQQFNKREQL